MLKNKLYHMYIYIYIYVFDIHKIQGPFICIVCYVILSSLVQRITTAFFGGGDSNKEIV